MVTVTLPAGGTQQFTADDWAVNDHTLHVLSSNGGTVATFAPGCWTSVSLDASTVTAATAPA